MSQAGFDFEADFAPARRIVDDDSPRVWAYGAGVDSTDGIIEDVLDGIRIDAILWANVGSERRETYAFIPVFNRWLATRGYPHITEVRYEPKTAPYTTMEGNMVLNATLPGATFNKGSCTSKFKIEPQNKWTRGWSVAQQAWASGRKVIKLIGYEADEGYRLKRADAKAHCGKDGSKDAELYEYRMPLMERGRTRQDCIDRIHEVIGIVPPKSACTLCPNQKPEEVDEATPEDRARTILVELSAEPYNQKVRGLWRRERKEDGRPGSITEYILAKGLPFTPLHEIAEQIVLNPNCKKAGTGITFDSPHKGPTLREQLMAAGQRVPEVVTEWDGHSKRYEESARQVSDIEDETHATLVAGL